MPIYRFLFIYGSAEIKTSFAEESSECFEKLKNFLSLLDVSHFGVQCMSMFVDRVEWGRNRSSRVTNEIVRRWNNSFHPIRSIAVNLINKKFPPKSSLLMLLESLRSLAFRLRAGKENSIGMKMFFQFKYLNFINSHNDVAEFKSVKRYGAEKLLKGFPKWKL